MTDKEIIKALECHTGKESNLNCCDCDYIQFQDCSQRMSCDALDLINRQQAEIENARIGVKSYKGKYESAVETARELKLVIAEKQAEIEMLKADKIIAERKEKDAGELFKNAVIQIEQVKSKAIKEYKEKLKEHAYLDSGITGFQEMVVDLSDIENIADEMVGEGK